MDKTIPIFGVLSSYPAGWCDAFYLIEHLSEIRTRRETYAEGYLFHGHIRLLDKQDFGIIDAQTVDPVTEIVMVHAVNEL
jgi:hypothetical protein